jgi:hypothetical protein
VARPTLITVRGQFLRIDGTPERGTVEFQSKVYTLYSSGSTATVPSRIPAALDVDGNVEIEVPATNDPAWIPQGWKYTLILRLSSDYSIFEVSVPYDAPGGEVTLAELIPVGGNSPIVPANYAPLVHTHTAADIVAGVIASARLPIGVTSGTVAAGDHTHPAGGDHQHTYGIADITGLTAALNSKAATAHTHVVGDVTGLTTALNGKANTSHTHVISDTTGLQAALDSKAPVGDYVSPEDLTGFATTADLDEKADVVHSHAQTDVTGLTDALAAKVDSEDLAEVALTGDYNDLANKPTMVGAPVTSVAGREGDIVLTKSDVGLANVDNTSDSAKPVSTATQTALDGKANAVHSHAQSDVTGLVDALAAKVDPEDLADVATSGSYNDLTDKPVIPTAPVTSVASKTGDVTLVKADVGLANVDNTSDLNKPVSTATQTALNAKANTSSLATVATSGNYNDLTNKPTITPPPVTSVASKTGDVTLVKGDVGLANVDNTSDANKPVSTATQSALDAKAPIASPTFTGTVSGVTKSMVGLGNVDNTSDANKPVSTATQTALNGKANTSHTHVVADVTGLQTALDDKATDAELAAGLATKADVGHVHEGAAVPNPITLTTLSNPPATPSAGNSILYTRDLNGGALLAFKGSSGTEYSVLRDVVFQVRNVTGATIAKGTPVYASGFSSGSDNAIEVAPALANSTTTMPVLGITVGDIANNAYGGCMRFGRLENVNTSAYAFRDLLYVSATTPGTMTATQPATTATSQRIATVARVHATQGVLYVDVQTMLHNSAGSNRETWTIGSGTSASLSYRMVSTGNTTSSLTATPTAARTWTLPDASGTLARTDEVTPKVTGPASATDNALVRFDATTGKLVQDSLVTVSDTGTVILTPQASVAYARGQLYYNSTTESLEFHNNNSNVAMQIGQELWIRVWNATGTAIANGAPVSLSGVDATSGLPTVVLANANALLTATVAGLATETIANGASGYVTVSGTVSGINTSAFTAGNPVYLSTTAGTLTSTIPTGSGNYRVMVGRVLVSNATTGRIQVQPSAPIHALGTANQILGMNNAATAYEYKTVNATNNQITVTNAANAITIGLATNTALPGAPTAATATAGTNTTQIATTAFVTTAASAKAPNLMVWNGSAYVASTTATLYVGPNDPGTVPDGSVWIDTDA